MIVLEAQGTVVSKTSRLSLLCERIHFSSRLCHFEVSGAESVLTDSEENLNVSTTIFLVGS